MACQNFSNCIYFFQPLKVFKFLAFIFVLSGGFLFAFVFFSNPVSAEINGIILPGSIENTGVHFEITDSEYFNITLNSSEEIKLKMESIPEMVTMMIEPVSSATFTQITVSGFLPSATYYKYQDDYHNLTEFVSDNNGTYSYAQDISTPHFVFIQPRKSTKFIKDDATGGDCSLIGNWNNATKTCALTADLNETIQIDGNNITLDGNNHTITGTGTGSGVYLYTKSGVTIKNFKIQQFSAGINSLSSGNNIFINNIILNNFWGLLFNFSNNNYLIDNESSNNVHGIHFFWSSKNNLINNNIFNNDYDGMIIEYYSTDNNLKNNIVSHNNYCGICLGGSYNFENIATLENNIISDNGYYGIYIRNAFNNNLQNNLISNNNYGIYIDVHSANNILSDNLIINNNFGIGVNSDGNIIYNNNFIDNLVQANVSPSFASLNKFNLPIPDGGNYWSNYDTPAENCNDLNNDKICDSLYFFPGGQDNLPWTIQDGWKISQNQLPTISNPNQYKSDGQTEIQEGKTTTESSFDNPNESIVVFKATLIDQDNDQVKLQVELREAAQIFTGTNLLESDFVSSGNEVQIIRQGLVDGQYKWRTRAIDDKGNASAWQEFGTAGNVDFEVKLVLLYTQIESEFPSRLPEDEWANLDYADGQADCGRSIAQCGCAITSSVMILRYYGVTNINNDDVNPKTMNDWLNANNGYQDHGVLDWQAVARYSDYQIDFDTVKSGNYFNDYIKLTDYLEQNQPAIAKEASSRGGIDREHFIVIDNKLVTAYGVKDPYWYNTRYLNEITDSANKRRGYENGFDGLRLFYPGDGIADAAVSLNLASPADFLITDPLGRKYGKDPITNMEYKEIPDATYFTESIDDATGELPPADHENKSFYIKNPLDGRYLIKIIGAGYGNYTFDSTVYDIQGQIHPKTFIGSTNFGIIASYNLNYDSQHPENISIQPEDLEPPVIFHTSINSNYILSSSPISFEFSAYDSGVGLFNLSAKLDGVSILSGQIINFDAIADHTIEIIAVDYLENVSAEIIDFNVVYNFGGFLPPIKSDSSGIYKLGGTLPIKFQLTDADNQFISTAVAKLYVAKISDGIIGTDEIPLSTSNADAGNIFRSETNQYIYNLSTDNLSLGTWRLKVVLDDGKDYTTLISLK